MIDLPPAKPEPKNRSLPTIRAIPASKRGVADLSLGVSFFGDMLAAAAGLWLGFWVRFRSDWITFGVELPFEYHLPDYAGLMGIGVAFLLITFAYLKLYDARNLLRFRRVAVIIFKGTLFWFCAYLGVSLALKFTPPISRLYVAISFVACLGALLGWRWVFHRVLRQDVIARQLRQRILFVGWNEDASALAKAIEHDRSQPYRITGYLPSPLEHLPDSLPSHIPRLGNYADLPALLNRRGTDMVVLADLDPDVGQIVSLSNLCERHYVQFKVIPTYFQILVSCLELDTISGVPILGNSELPLERPTNRLVKRVVDIFGAAVGLVLSIPIVIICGLAVYAESPGSILYRQVRMGRNGRRFKIIKIRSMRLDAEASGAQWAKKDDPRRLRIGAFMRKWNLDEVPQFWNVLKGEMSLVGPRPERPELIDSFQEEIPHYNARHGSKPGMTGWAQVNGLRGDTSLVERVRYDLYYLENWSLLLDFQIMAQTFVKRDNAY